MTDPSPQPDISTDGGAVIGGDVNVDRGGTFVGRDIVGYTAGQVSALLTQLSTQFQPKPFTGRCPYMGLDVFTEEDADLFFGRERLVAELIERVKQARFVVIAGPSGSGKSSLVRAGLLHALKNGSLPNSDRWLYATLTPGRDPIESLALAMSRMAKSPDAGKYPREHSAEPSALHEFAESQLSDRADQRAVIFVDQFEEVFTQVSKEDERLAFLNLLTDAATHESGRVTVLFALRSDFVSNCATYPQLNALLNQQFMQVGAMQPDELVSAIARPALQVGLRIDPDLVAQIVNDMQDEPGALPLMQFALKDLFDAQQAKGGLIALTLNDYLARGGLRKALERHADAAFAKLSDSEQQLARTIFSGLIEIGRGTQDTRRTATLEELVPANVDAAQVKEVVQKLADARLITTDEHDHHVTVTIAHETLIDAWPWLRRLINENREAIALQNQIAEDAQEWEGHQRDASYLYRGARLATAREELGGRKIVFSKLAQEFVEAGIEAFDSARRRRRRIVQGTIGGLVIIMLVFGGLATWAVNSQQVAQSNATEAQRQSRIALSRQLAAQSQMELETGPQRSLLLGIEALKVTMSNNEPRIPEAEDAIRKGLSVVGGVPLTNVDTLALSPNGQWLATNGSDNVVSIWNLSELNLTPLLIRANTDHIQALAFSPDNRWFACGGDNANVQLWDVINLSSIGTTLNGHIMNLNALVFSPDGHWLATKGLGKSIDLWNMSDMSAGPTELIGHSGDVVTIAFSPDSHWLVSGSDDTTARVWNVLKREITSVVLTGHKGPVSELAFSPDSLLLATVNSQSSADRTRVWRLDSLSNNPILLDTGLVDAMAFSPDGQFLATGGVFSHLELWRTKNFSMTSIMLAGGPNLYQTLEFSKDGHWLASGDWNGTVRLWDMSDTGADPQILRGSEGAIQYLAFSPDGKKLVSGGLDRIARVWHLPALASTPIILNKAEELTEGGVSNIAFSPDGHLLAVSHIFSREVQIWDMNNLNSKPQGVYGQNKALDAMTFTTDNRWLSVVDGDSLRFWDLTNNLTTYSITWRQGENTASLPIGMHLDENWTVAVNDDPGVRVWKVSDSNISWIRIPDSEGFISNFSLSSDGRWLVVLDQDPNSSSLRLWSLTNTQSPALAVTNSTDRAFSDAAFSSDTGWLAVSISNTIQLWDLNNLVAPPITLSADQPAFGLLAFAPDGQWIAATTSPEEGDDSILVWNTSHLNTDPILLRGQELEILDLAFSPDSRWLVTIGRGSTVRVWDVTDFELMPIVLQAHSFRTAGLVFSPDGVWMASAGGWDDIVDLWVLGQEELIQLGCRIVGRNFTRVEWSQYFPELPYRKTCEQWPLEPDATPTPIP